MLKGVVEGSAEVYNYMEDLNLSHSLVKTTLSLILIFHTIHFSLKVQKVWATYHQLKILFLLESLQFMFFTLIHQWSVHGDITIGCVYSQKTQQEEGLKHCFKFLGNTLLLSAGELDVQIEATFMSVESIWSYRKQLQLNTNTRNYHWTEQDSLVMVHLPAPLKLSN